MAPLDEAKDKLTKAATVLQEKAMEFGDSASWPDLAEAALEYAYAKMDVDAYKYYAELGEDT